MNRARRRRLAGVAALGLLVALGACADGDGDGSTPTTPVDDGGAGAEPDSATVTLDGAETVFELTNCVSGDGRITIQGNDGQGRTVVGSFASGSPGGSLTVSDPDSAWVGGSASGADFATLAVTEGRVEGAGPFAIQTYGPADATTGVRPVIDTGATAEGTFSINCATTTVSPPP